MNAWCSSICLLSIAVIFACYGTTPRPICFNNIVVALSLVPNSRRTQTQPMQQQRTHRLLATSNTVEEEEKGESTNKCGTGFHAEATTNGEEVCVFDYDAATTLEVSASAAIEVVIDE